MTRRRFVDRSEAGTSLIIALAMVMVISVGLVASLGFASASLKSVGAMTTQRLAAYSADSAMDTALQTLRINTTSGTTAVGTACPTVAYPASGVQPLASVTCTVVATRGKGVPGVSMPPYAIWALGSSATEPGLYASPSLEVNGPVASNSPANGANGYDSVQTGALDLAGYTLDARGSCSGTITVNAPGDKRCNTGVSIADPLYVAQAAPALTSPNPAPTCAVADGVLQFNPGYYTNTAMLETPAYGACRVGYLYFKPGVYYFDFGFDPAYPGESWDVTAGQTIVGGELKNWNPATAASMPGAPGGGTSVACKNEVDGATTGVQFIFGGASRMSVAAAASVELCADPTPVGTSQEIAIYGQKSGSGATPTTVRRVPTGPASASPWTNLQNTRLIGAGTTPIDGQIASVPIASGATNTLTLTGYPATAVPPGGSTNVSYTLRVAHQETGAAGSVSSVTATIGACVLNATPHVTTTLSAPVTDSFVLNPACVTAVTSAFSVAYKVTAAAAAFTENLDGIELVVTWTPPALHPESGCITVIGVGAGGCSLLTLGPNGAKVVMWGTIYAPLASVLSDDSGSSVIEFRRGVVARAVGILNVPAGDSSGNFCLGGGLVGGLCSGQIRVLRLAATVTGKVRLRTLVRITDTPALGTVFEVLAWNVVR